MVIGFRLEPGEQLLWSGRPRQRPSPAEWVTFAAPLAVLILNHGWFDWALFGVAGIVGIVGYVSRANTFYGITSHRFIMVRGTQTKTYSLALIESASISREVMKAELLTIHIWDRRRRRAIKVVLQLQDDAKPVRDLIESLHLQQPPSAYA